MQGSKVIWIFFRHPQYVEQTLFHIVTQLENKNTLWSYDPATDILLMIFKYPAWDLKKLAWDGD
jgi:hypothetical protein